LRIPADPVIIHDTYLGTGGLGELLAWCSRVIRSSTEHCSLPSARDARRFFFRTPAPSNAFDRERIFELLPIFENPGWSWCKILKQLARPLSASLAFIIETTSSFGNPIRLATGTVPNLFHFALAFAEMQPIN